jgi:hypothetical protein
MRDERSSAAVRLGDIARAARLTQHRTLAATSAELGRSSGWLSDLEHGRGDGASLRSWIELLASLGLEVDWSIRGEAADVASTRSAAMADAVAGIAVDGGWARRDADPAFLELERVERRWDWYRACRAVIAIWDQVPDAVGGLAALEGRVADLRPTVPGRDAVAGLVVVRRDADARRRLGPRPASGSQWIAALQRRDVRMPAGISMCWFDETRDRLVPMGLTVERRRRPRSKRLVVADR